MPSTESGEQAYSSVSLPVFWGRTRGHRLSPDRTKLCLLDSDGWERGGRPDLSWCQALGHLETGADRVELVKLLSFSLQPQEPPVWLRSEGGQK